MYIIRSRVFANSIVLRKEQSDPFIFEQIFCEQQYTFGHPAKQDVKWIIDAGANIGLAAVYFSAEYPNARIISIEPDKENFALLQKNTSNYKNVTCINAALWYKEEKLDISNKEEKSAGYMMEPKLSNDVDLIKGITVEQLMKQFSITEISMLKIETRLPNPSRMPNKTTSSNWPTPGR